MTVITELKTLLAKKGGLENYKGTYIKYSSTTVLRLIEAGIIGLALFVQAMPFMFTMISTDIKSVDEFGSAIYPTVIWVALLMPSAQILYDSIKRPFLSKKSEFIERDELKSLEKSLENKFGSIDKAIQIYNELKGINIELSDENFLKLLNETSKSTKKRETVKETTKSKLSRTEERIRHYQQKIKELEEKKDDILNKGIEQENNIFINNNITEIDDKTEEQLSIEHKKQEDISILFKEKEIA